MPKLYFTAGRGTEKFVQEELKENLQAVEVQVQDGRVLCEVADTETTSTRLRQLRTVERAFVLVSIVATHTITHLSPSVIISVLKQRLLTREALLEAYRVHRHLHQSLSLSQSGLEPSPKRLRTDTALEEHSSGPRFRISVKCSGRLGRKINPQVVAGCLGRELAASLAWKVDLRHPDVEVCVHVGDQWLIAGIPIFRQPLSKRSFLADPGLRSTVAAIMTRLASIQPGEVVLDPMCGKATVLLEGATTQPAAVYLGVDRDKSQLTAAAANIHHACLSVSLLQADALSLPLPACSVDKIVCDAPFGQKFQTTQSLEQFYATFLQEWARVLKPSGRAVLLTSAGLQDSVTRITRQSQSPGATDCQAARLCDPCPSLPALPWQCQSSDSGVTGSGKEGPGDGDSEEQRETATGGSDVRTDVCKENVHSSRDLGSAERREEQHSCVCEAEGQKCRRDAETCAVSTKGRGCTCACQSLPPASNLAGSPHSSSKRGNSSSMLHSQHPHSEAAHLLPYETGDDVDRSVCAECHVCNGERKGIASTSSHAAHRGHGADGTGLGGERLGSKEEDGTEQRPGHCSLPFQQSLSVVEQHYVKLGETHAYIILMKCQLQQRK